MKLCDHQTVTFSIENIKARRHMSSRILNNRRNFDAVFDVVEDLQIDTVLCYVPVVTITLKG